MKLFFVCFMFIFFGVGVVAFFSDKENNSWLFTSKNKVEQVENVVEIKPDLKHNANMIASGDSCGCKILVVAYKGREYLYNNIGGIVLVPIEESVK